MAITLVASGVDLEGDGVEPSVALSGLQQNDLVIAAASFTTTDGISSSGYTEAISIDQGFGAFLKIEWKRMGATPDTSVAANDLSNITCVLCVMAFRGVDPTTALDVTPTSVDQGSSAVPNPPSITTVTDGCAIVVGGFNNATDAAVTAPSGYGDLVNDGGQVGFLPRSGAAAWMEQETLGAEDPAAFTDWASGNNCVGWTVALRPAAEAAIGAQSYHHRFHNRAG